MTSIGSTGGACISPLAFLTFLRIPASLVWKKIFTLIFSEFSSLSAQNFWWLCQPFPRSPVLSFLPEKQRDFPGNVSLGGCDSLPLVVAFTSKQHDSPLSYALHFLHIISHQMCCAGERAERCAQQTVEKSLPLPEKKCKKSRSCLRGETQAVCFVLYLDPQI